MALIDFLMVSTLLWTTGFIWCTPTISKDQLIDIAEPIDSSFWFFNLIGTDFPDFVKTSMDRENFKVQQNFLNNTTPEIYIDKGQSSVNKGPNNVDFAGIGTGITVETIKLIDQNKQEKNTSVSITPFHQRTPYEKREKRSLGQFWDHMGDPLKIGLDKKIIPTSELRKYAEDCDVHKIPRISKIVPIPPRSVQAPWKLSLCRTP